MKLPVISETGIFITSDAIVEIANTAAINSIDETLNKMYTVADECCEKLYEKFGELNDLSVQNDKFSPIKSIYKARI